MVILKLSGWLMRCEPDYRLDGTKLLVDLLKALSIDFHLYASATVLTNSCV